VIGDSIRPMPILNTHLTHARFISAHNLSHLRRLAHTCFGAHGYSGGWWLCVFTSENEADFPVEKKLAREELVFLPSSVS
jgi:hypothetical protein